MGHALSFLWARNGYSELPLVHPGPRNAKQIFRRRVVNFADVLSGMLVAVDNATKWKNSLLFFELDEEVRPWLAFFGFALIALPFVLDFALLWEVGTATLARRGVRLPKLAYAVFGLPAMVVLRIWLLIKYPCSEPAITTLSPLSAYEQVDTALELLSETPGQILLYFYIIARRGLVMLFMPSDYAVPRLNGLVVLAFVISVYNQYVGYMYLRNYQDEENALRDAREKLPLIAIIQSVLFVGQKTSYTMHGHCWGPKLSEELQEALRSPSVLQALIFTNMRCTDVEPFGQALAENNVLQSLRLHRDEIADVAKLGHGLAKNAALQMLDLSGNRISDVSEFGSVLEKNAVLQVLDLSNNPIKDVAALAQGLTENKSLRLLRLEGNRIADIEALSQALHRSKALQVLDLSSNFIRDADALGLALENNETLQVLDLSGNLVIDVTRFGPALATNRTLQSLDLSSNHIIDVAVLGRGLAANRALKLLRLECNRIVDTAELKFAVENNRTLRLLRLEGNPAEELKLFKEEEKHQEKSVVL